MHIQSWDYAAAGAAPVRAGLLRRIAGRIAALSYTCTLDPHLADDAGQLRYSVPLFTSRDTRRQDA